MTKLPFAMLLAGAALLATSCLSRTHRLTIEIRPASSEEVELRARGGGRLRFHVSANELGTDAKGLVGFTAPATLEIAGGDGQLELSAADTAQRFVMIVKRDIAGVTGELEAQGQRAVIRMRDGKMKVETESMTMREVRVP